MDGYKLSQLRKKLEALNYKQPLEASSAPLVDKLVTDLLHTTDSYRDLKLQVAKKSQEVEDSQHKVHQHVQPNHCSAFQSSGSAYPLPYVGRWADKGCRTIGK